MIIKVFLKKLTKIFSKPRVGHTVYVYGHGISEDLLRTTFTQFGQIVNISMEVEKNCGFITYDRVESAER